MLIAAVTVHGWENVARHPIWKGYLASVFIGPGPPGAMGSRRRIKEAAIVYIYTNTVVREKVRANMCRRYKEATRWYPRDMVLWKDRMSLY